MAQLTPSTPGTLRRLRWLRSLFLWPLMVLLLAGAASYTHGSRYALVHGQPAAQVLQVLQVPPQEQPGVARNSSLPAAAEATVVHKATQFVAGQAMEKDDCERRQAPRGEPAPLKTGTVDPPSLSRPHPLEGETSGLAPPEPELPALTVVALSISRT